MNIIIEQLTDTKSPHFRTVLDWNDDWWGHPRNRSREYVEEFMKNMLCVDKIAQTYIALNDGECVGSYQLCMFDYVCRPDLYPWLINVYVAEKHRGKGICSALMSHAKETLKKLNQSKCYLYTRHEGLYEKYDWKNIGKVKMWEKFGRPEYEYLYKLKIE